MTAGHKNLALYFFKANIVNKKYNSGIHIINIDHGNEMPSMRSQTPKFIRNSTFVSGYKNKHKLRSEYDLAIFLNLLIKPFLTINWLKQKIHAKLLDLQVFTITKYMAH